MVEFDLIGGTYVPELSEDDKFKVKPSNSYSDLYNFVNRSPSSSFTTDDPLKQDVACLYAGKIDHLGWKDSKGKNMEYNFQLAGHKSQCYFYKRIDDTPIFSTLMNQEKVWGKAIENAKEKILDRCVSDEDRQEVIKKYDSALKTMNNAIGECWALASKRFVQTHQGDFMVYGLNANPESVLRSTELRTIVSEKEDCKINGIHVSEFRAELEEKNLRFGGNKEMNAQANERVYLKAVCNEYINKRGTELREFYSPLMLEHKQEKETFLLDKSNESDLSKTETAKQDTSYDQQQNYQQSTHQGYGY